jgi:type I restriction enzyme M protein
MGIAINETNTETIFENYISQYADAVALGTHNHDWIYERQSSKNEKINKLLLAASKTAGTGRGRPDFIIQNRKDPSFIISIECKASIFKHESPNRDQYADYAVDGALLYSSFLSKSFDVLSIAVSGESFHELRISHLMQLRGEQTAVPMFGDKLLPLTDYYSGYIKSPEKFRQDYQTLLDFSKSLNDKLHKWKIAEDERALLISCVLIALENEGFIKSYADYSDPKQLAQRI